MKPTKSCWNCQHASHFHGFGGSREEPPEDPAAECTHDDYAERQESEAFALECPGYTPTLVERCGRYRCQKPVGVPEIEHEFWAYTPYSEAYAVCSAECSTLADQETAADLAAEQRAELYAERQQSMWEINLED